MVQSLLGRTVGTALSKEWGGTVSIGSMNINVMGRVRLREVQLITPTGDTVADMQRLTVRYDDNPIQPDGLHLRSVYIGPTYFHLLDKDGGLTLLQFIHFLTDKLASDDKEEEEETPREHPFVVRIETVVARNIHYKQTLNDSTDMPSPTGINVPDMEFTHINFKFRNVRIDPSPRITLRMERFSARETSGLHVESLRMNTYVGYDGIAATNMELETDSTRFYGDVLIRYNGFHGFSHFFDSVRFDVTFKEGTSCNMKDASYWTHTLWGMDEQIALEGVAHGPLGNFTVEQMQVALGDHTSLLFNGTMQGLPVIDSTRFDIHLQQLATHYDDLASIHWSETVHVPFPHLLNTMGHIAATGRFSGTIRNFATQATTITDAGRIMAQGTMRYDAQTHDYHYHATVHSPELHLSAVAANDWVSHTGVDLTVAGKGFDPSTLTAELHGSLHSTVLHGVPLQNTLLMVEADKGQWKADVAVQDSSANIDLTLWADLRDDIGRYEFSGNVKHIDLARLHLWNRDADSSATLSTSLQGTLSGNDIEHLSGMVRLDNTHLILNNDTLALRTAALNVIIGNDHKNITFNSDIATLSIKGYFAYSDLPAMARRFVTSYTPNYYTRNLKTDEVSIPVSTTIGFDMQWHDTLQHLAHFVPSLHIATGTHLHGYYNFYEQLKAVLRSDSIGWGNTTLHGFNMSTAGNDDKYSINLDVQQLTTPADTLMKGIYLNTSVAATLSSAHLYWNNNDTGPLNRGDLALRLHSTDTGNCLQVTQGSIEMNTERWTLSTVAPICFDNHSLLLPQLSLRSGKQSLLATAQLLHDSNDRVMVAFNHFRLQQLNPLLHATGFTISGSLNGNMELRDLQATPYFSTDLTVDSTAVSGQVLGTTRIASTWEPATKKIQMQLTTDLPTDADITHPIVAAGTVDIAQAKHIGLDFDVRLDGFRLQTLQPLVRSAVSELQGGLRGHFYIRGTARQPELTGTGYIDDGAARVTVTNVRYTFNDSITFSNDQIRFNRFALHDPNGNKAYVDGFIAHNNLKDFALNFTLTGENMLVLSTTARQSNYYGTLLANVTGRVQGPLDDLDIHVAARTLRGSELVVPITQQRSVQDVNFIHFVEPVGIRRTVRPVVNTSQNAFHMVADIQITPEVELQLPVDVSPMTAAIKAKGNGTLEVEVGNAKPLSINGNYEIGNGTMDITLIGVLSKSFSLEEGSTINFPGTLSAATFNLHAIHSQRVKLSPLVGSTADNAQTFVQVENVITLSGSLSAPAVSFDLRLPGADQSLQDEVFSYIDRSSEKDMMNQTMSLLMLNQFYGAGNANEPSAGGTSMVVNTLSGVLTDMIEFANINIDYRGATANSSSQVEMGVSHEWDKFYFEGTFGYGGEIRNLEEVKGVRNLTGDLLIGRKFTPQLHGYVFNRSNTNDYTRSDLPYKQGLGVKFVRDYDRWRDLFRSSKKTHKREQQRKNSQNKNATSSGTAADDSTTVRDSINVPALQDTLPLNKTMVPHDSISTTADSTKASTR